MQDPWDCECVIQLDSQAWYLCEGDIQENITALFIQQNPMYIPNDSDSRVCYCEPPIYLSSAGF